MDVENVGHFNKLDKTACPLESMCDYGEIRLVQLHYVSLIFTPFLNGFTYYSLVASVPTPHNKITLHTTLQFFL
jgi:hypothetical protein